jgi:Domain of unknown function (DUF4157)
MRLQPQLDENTGLLEPRAMQQAASQQLPGNLALNRIGIFPGGSPVPQQADPHEKEAERFSSIAESQHAHTCKCGGTCPKCKARAAAFRNSQPRSQYLSHSSGNPLHPATQSRMESLFQMDFSQVRIHTGPDASQAAEEAFANAYTEGRNIIFGSGRYQPETTEGRKLLAHELTHVVQQGNGSATGIQHEKDKRWVHDINAARYRGGLMAKRIRNHGLLSKEAREKIHDELAYFDGAARDAYIETVKPALVKVHASDVLPPDAPVQLPKLLPLIMDVHTPGEFTDDQIYAPLNEQKQKEAEELEEDKRRELNRLKDLIEDWPKEYQALATNLLKQALNQGTHINPAGLSDSDRTILLGILHDWLVAVDKLRLKSCDPNRSGMDTMRATVNNDDPCKSWFEFPYSHGPNTIQHLTTLLKLHRPAQDSGLTPAQVIAADVFDLRMQIDPILLEQQAMASAMLNLLVGLAGAIGTVGAPPATTPLPGGEPPTGTLTGPSPNVIQGGGEGGPPSTLQEVNPDNTLGPPVTANKPPPSTTAPPGANPAVNDNLPATPAAANDNAPPGDQQHQLQPTGTDGASGTVASSSNSKTPVNRRTVYTPRNRSNFDDPYEKGRRPPTQKDVTGGPQTTSQDVDELGEVNQTGEKVTTKRKTDRPVSDDQLHSQAGTAIEPRIVDEWAQKQPKGATVYRQGNLPESLSKLFPKGPNNTGGPDAISVTPPVGVAKGKIVVFDSAPADKSAHSTGTKSDALTIKQNLPDAYKGYDVFAQEGWYKGDKVTFSPQVKM